jgi:ubiquinone/menaquinone biosynthesis C-methylase UbiE
MKKEIKLYESAKNYFAGPEGMKNEVTMWFVAAGLLMQELSKKIGNRPYGGLKGKRGYEENKKLKEINILDLCSGPGNFVNHLSFVFPNINITCVDLNVNFINVGRKVFKKWRFVEGDATKIILNKKFDFIVASSAYHHVEDKDKSNFLKTIYNHLTDGGTAIICENFLPDYKTNSERKKSINKYYDELEKWFSVGNATNEAIKIIKDVRKQELNNEEEHKVSRKIFNEHVGKSGLKITTDIAVWQTHSLMPDSGSYVVELVKK